MGIHKFGIVKMMTFYIVYCLSDISVPIMAQLSRQKFDIFIMNWYVDELHGKCVKPLPDFFILCGCSGCIQKHYRIVYLSRSFVPNGLMASFKVIGVDISSDGFYCFLEISILREICFLILEAAESAFNHDIICPSAFAIHALPDSVITKKVDVFVTGKLASLIRVDD